MWPQIVSSLAAGAVLVVAAVILHSPFALLGIALVCMMAFASHGFQLEGNEQGHLWATTIGLLLAVIIWFYLIYLAAQGVF